MFKKMIVFLMTLAVALTCCCAALAESTTKEFVFEAEYVDLTYLSGRGYSNEVSGSGLLIQDKYNAGASNGYALGYLYEEGNEIEFWINASADVENVTLVLRCSMESYDPEVNIEWDEMEIKVIPADMYDDADDIDPIEYKTISFNNIPGLIVLKGALIPFANKTISRNVSLAEGENLIRITITNNEKMGGTMYAKAPVFDCIILKTDADVELTWAEGFPMNVDYIEANR